MSNNLNPFSPPETEDQTPNPLPKEVMAIYKIGFFSAVLLVIFSIAIYLSFRFGSGRFFSPLAWVFMAGFVSGLAAIVLGILNTIRDIRYLGPSLFGILVVAIWMLLMASLPTMPS